MPLFGSTRRQPPASSAPSDSAAGAAAKRDLTGGLKTTFRALSIPQFRTFWLGMLLSMAGNHMDIVARAWLAYTISGSALTLGLVTLARGLPMLVFAVVGGVVADRFNKRRLLIVLHAIMSILGIANALIVHFGIVEVWHLVVLGVLQGLVFPMIFPARQAYIPDLVGRENLSNAVAVTSSGVNANRVLAPVVAGLLLSWSPAMAFYAIAIAYATCSLMLLRLPKASAVAERAGSAAGEILGVFGYIWDDRRMRTLMLLAIVPVVLGLPFQQLLPVFQQSVLNVGPAELGVMYMATGIGALAGTISVARFSSSPHLNLMQLICGIAFGVFLLAFSLSGSFQLSVALLVLVGFTSQGYMTINNTLLMMNARPQFYGRVAGVYLAIWSLMTVATLPFGVVIDLVGAPATLATGGGLLALVCLAIALLAPGRARERPADGK